MKQSSTTVPPGQRPPGVPKAVPQATQPVSPKQTWGDRIKTVGFWWVASLVILSVLDVLSNITGSREVLYVNLGPDRFNALYDVLSAIISTIVAGVEAPILLTLTIIIALLLNGPDDTTIFAHVKFVALFVAVNVLFIVCSFMFLFDIHWSRVAFEPLSGRWLSLLMAVGINAYQITYALWSSWGKSASKQFDQKKIGPVWVLKPKNFLVASTGFLLLFFIVLFLFSPFFSGAQINASTGEVSPQTQIQSPVRSLPTDTPPTPTTSPTFPPPNAPAIVPSGNALLACGEGYIAYVVQYGETLSDIATRFNRDIRLIRRVDGTITNLNNILEGETLCLPLER